MMKCAIISSGILLAAISLQSQTCSCEKEFLYIQHTVEQNAAVFPDRIKFLSPAVYKKEVDQLLQLTHSKSASDNCVLIISKYLDIFKSHHLGFFPSFDPYKTDTDFVNHRPIFKITDATLAKLKKSTSWEGIYNFTYDSSTKIAVIKDPGPLHDYIGVTLESTRATWKKGMIKFEGKLVNDSVLEGLLYMRNHRPKLESFFLHDHNSMISGDWRREGTPKQERREPASAMEPSPTIDAKKLTPNTLYIKMSSFSPDYKPIIDSILKANDTLLQSTPNLVLDLRDNGGGSDNCWEPLIPYLYTNPLKNIGADVLATETTISGKKQYLENKHLTKESIAELTAKIARMEKAKGQWITDSEDYIDSSFKPMPFPQKIIILMNRWCGSSTEELLLTARQSSKVILAGENSIGNLDYSNTVQTPFSCFPYTLVYPTTRSRRLNIGQGIDNIGIAPNYRLAKGTDWVKEAVKIAENKNESSPAAITH